MSFEILYTSALEGLRKGSHGYCTVVSTRGIPKTLAERLEMRGGYLHPFPPGDSKNPVNFSHILLTVGGTQYHLLSRISDYGYDYSRRSNKLAHHVAVTSEELTPEGPAKVLEKEGFCETTWDGKAKLLEVGRVASSIPYVDCACHEWERLCGDAGWAGILAESAISPQKKAAYVIFKPGQDMLSLVVEAMGLLPENIRWQTTFSTFYTKLQASDSIRWCFVLDGSQEAGSIRRDPRVTLVDLCSQLGPAPDGPYVNHARTGNQIEPINEPPKIDSDESFIPVIDEPPKSRRAKKSSGVYQVSAPEIKPQDIDDDDDLSIDGSLYSNDTMPCKRKKRRGPHWVFMAGLTVLLLFAIVGTIHILYSSTSVPEISKVADSPKNAKVVKEKTPKGKGSKENPATDEGESPRKDTDQESVSNAEKKSKPDPKTNSKNGEAETSQQSATKLPSDPKASNPTPPKKVEKSPLNKLPDCLNLPAPPKGKGNPFQSAKVESVSSQLDLKKPDELKIELLGSEALALNDKEKFTLEEDKKTKKFDITYINKSLVKPIRLGYFELKTGQLLFHPNDAETDKRAYEVFRCCLIRFSYSGENRVCSLREPSLGNLTREKISSEGEGWMAWKYEWDKDNPLENNPPNLKSLKLYITIKNCLKDSQEEEMVLSLAKSSNETKTSADENNPDRIKFEAKQRSDENGNSQLLLKASLGLKMIDEVFKGKLKLTETSLVLSEENIGTVERHIDAAEENFERIENQIETTDKDNDKRKNLLTSKKNKYKDVIDSAENWRKKAKSFQKRLKSVEAEIEATLKVGHNEMDVPIITFSTKN
jgi:GTPase-associated protein 1